MIRVGYVYEAYNSLGFSVGRFTIVDTHRETDEEMLCRIAEKELRSEVVVRCELVDITKTTPMVRRTIRRIEGLPVEEVKLRQGPNRNWLEDSYAK